MLDAVDLIGKTIMYGDNQYNILTIYFMPDAPNNNHTLYFGLLKEGNRLNISYKDLLPYLKEQIKL